jgi:ribosomal protein S18 acetylase RimI-like enzyme
VKVALRPVTPADAPFLTRVYASTRAAELAQVPWTDAQKEAFIAHQFTAQAAHYERHYAGASFDVVLAGGEPAGRLYVARGAEEIRIVDIALLPAFRGRGIGTGLLRALLGEADAQGKRVSIHVEQSNPALRLYERLGFAPAGETGVHLLMVR